MTLYASCSEHGSYANPHGCPLCRLSYAGRKWYGMNIRERRTALEAANLWDGNTYALPAWDSLPTHIRQDLADVIVVTEGDKQLWADEALLGEEANEG